MLVRAGAAPELVLNYYRQDSFCLYIDVCVLNEHKIGFNNENVVTCCNLLYSVQCRVTNSSPKVLPLTS
jgi:hypothetical protein